jgi:hypothetical protein
MMDFGALRPLRQLSALFPVLPAYARLFLVALTLILTLAVTAFLVTATHGGWGAHVTSLPAVVASIAGHIFQADTSLPCALPTPCP